MASPRERAAPACRAALALGRAPERFVHGSPFRWPPRSLTRTVNDRTEELIPRYCRNRAFIQRDGEAAAARTLHTFRCYRSKYINRHQNGPVCFDDTAFLSDYRLNESLPLGKPKCMPIRSKENERLGVCGVPLRWATATTASPLCGISSSPAVYCKQNPFLLHRNAYQEPLAEPCVLNRSD